MKKKAKFKVGDNVFNKSRGKGKIICVNKIQDDWYTIEFFNKVKDGHNGYVPNLGFMKKGKDNHCFNLSGNNLKFISKPKLKKFLEEFKNEQRS